MNDAATSPATSAPSASRRRSLIPWYVGALVLGTAAVAGFSSYERIAHSPFTFGLLIALTLALDTVRIDIFERGNISPATVPAIALAYLFGPAGPVCGEAAILITRALRPGPALIKRTFDFGSLSLAGAAAAGVFALVPVEHAGPVLGASVLASLGYYLVNSLFVALVWGLDEGISPLEAWLERMAWLWPHNMAGGAVAGFFVLAEEALGASAFILFCVPLAMAWVTQKQYVDRSRTSVAALRSSHHELEATNEQLRVALTENEKLLVRTKHAYLSTITSLARTIEAKDPYTGGHTERVAEYALTLAREVH